MLNAMRSRVPPSLRLVARTRHAPARTIPKRFASTTPPGSSGTGVSYVLAAGLAVASGAAGYTFANSSGQVAEARHAPPPERSTPQYGTPDDYKKAIGELLEAFGGDEEAVSTDEGTLELHGFGVHDSHPGASILPSSYLPCNVLISSLV
jgi:D-lactate dehydrogenase (cytochrome)